MHFVTEYCTRQQPNKSTLALRSGCQVFSPFLLVVNKQKKPLVLVKKLPERSSCSNVLLKD